MQYNNLSGIFTGDRQGDAGEAFCGLRVGEAEQYAVFFALYSLQGINFFNVFDLPARGVEDL